MQTHYRKSVAILLSSITLLLLLTRALRAEQNLPNQAPVQHRLVLFEIFTRPT
jgi:hypothetical protein